MTLFSRKKSAQAVLPEIEKYYEAERRERAGLAWLLALTSIAVVALVLIGAFFGGRWVYRKAAHTDKPKVTVTTVVKDDASKNEGVSSTTAQTTPTSTSAPTTAPTQATQVTTTVSASAIASQNTKLANTGPANTVAVFIVAVLGFSALHYVVNSRRTN